MNHLATKAHIKKQLKITTQRSSAKILLNLLKSAAERPANEKNHSKASSFRKEQFTW